MAYDFAVMWEWLSLGVRWLHVIAGIAWIGSSFYFIALDLSLQKNKNLPKGVGGDTWQVHGGGFYHIMKYLVAPKNLPEKLTWFKWESYVTWLSGFALLIIVYYVGANLYLVDRQVLDITTSTAIIISLVSLCVGWLSYNFLCKMLLHINENVLMIILFFMLVIFSWGYTEVFSGRAAFLHIGALTASIMVGNVFFIIMPNQKIVVAQLKAGKVPLAKYGIIAKQRSIHNNYLTLPVLFMMISNHYPLAFATQYNWLIAGCIFLMGVAIRYYFNARHAGSGNPTWVWLVAALLFLFAAWLSSFGVNKNLDVDVSKNKFSTNVNFAKVEEIIQTRCVMCHSQEPVYPSIVFAPKNIILEKKYEIIKNAREIYLQAGRTNAMPLANVSSMTNVERAIIVNWYEESVK